MMIFVACNQIGSMLIRSPPKILRDHSPIFLYSLGLARNRNGLDFKIQMPNKHNKIQEVFTKNENVVLFARRKKSFIYLHLNRSNRSVNDFKRLQNFDNIQFKVVNCS